MPQISSSGSTHDNYREYGTRGFNFPKEKDQFNSHNWQVNATQPVWRYSLIADKKQSRAQLFQAGHQLDAARQTLVAQLVEAWMALLAARDQQAVMAKQEQAARLQRDMYERGLQLGLQGLPQRDEAVSKLAQAESDRFRADAEYEIKRAALEQYAGDIPSPDLPRWREGTAPPAEDRPLEQWLGYIRDNSPEIQAARKAVDVAREDVGKQLANYMPSIDLVGNVSGNGQSVGGFPGQNGYDIRQSYVGLQANWTLFTSGVQSGKVREARAMLDKAEQSLENTLRLTLNHSKQAWYSERIAHRQWQSLQHQLTAARSALKAARHADSQGIKGQMDILQAEHQLADTEAALAKACYEGWTSRFKLMALAGLITLQDLERLDHQFRWTKRPVPNREHIIHGG